MKLFQLCIAQVAGAFFLREKFDPYNGVPVNLSIFHGQGEDTAQIGKMPVDRGGFSVATGEHLFLNPSAFPGRDVSDHALSKQECPEAAVPPFVLYSPVGRSFETMLNPDAQGDIFFVAVLFREIVLFALIGLESPIQGLRLCLIIGPESLFPSVDVDSYPPLARTLRVFEDAFILSV
ncbi:MAG: hypothetical protein ACE5GK_12330 [Nitrospiria bacterium]